MPRMGRLAVQRPRHRAHLPQCVHQRRAKLPPTPPTIAAVATSTAVTTAAALPAAAALCRPPTALATATAGPMHGRSVVY